MFEKRRLVVAAAKSLRRHAFHFARWTRNTLEWFKIP
jgi:hypothetical protein